MMSGELRAGKMQRSSHHSLRGLGRVRWRTIVAQVMFLIHQQLQVQLAPCCSWTGPQMPTASLDHQTRI